MADPHITVLIDNHSCREDLLCQYGLSLWLEAGGKKILVDTGNNGDFLLNGDRLGISPQDADWLAVTHGHWDHAGGVPSLLAKGGRPRILMHPDAWKPRRAVQADGSHRDIGVPWPETALEEADIFRVPILKPQQLAPGIWSTGPIPDWTGREDQSVLQVKQGDSWSNDSFADEHALVLETVEGLVVISGCSHRGVLNILRAAQLMTGEGQIHTVIGGLHLKDATAEECEELAERLTAFNLSNLWVNHCTGELAFDILKARLGSMVAWAGSGFTGRLPALKSSPV
ncbi:MAG: MBL fold metallo-hydrolase [Desulfuromonadales bacterium]